MPGKHLVAICIFKKKIFINVYWKQDGYLYYLVMCVTKDTRYKLLKNYSKSLIFVALFYAKLKYVQDIKFL